MHNVIYIVTIHSIYQQGVRIVAIFSDIHLAYMRVKKIVGVDEFQKGEEKESWKHKDSVIEIQEFELDPEDNTNE